MSNPQWSFLTRAISLIAANLATKQGAIVMEILGMSLSKRQIGKLNKIIAMAQSLIDSHNGGRSGPRARSSSRRLRRSSAEAAKMRADILARRAKGVSALSLAKKYNVSTAYIYMIK
jgi:Mor family transcriptional regulator